LYFEQIVYIALLEQKEKIKEYADALDRICKMANRILKVNTSAGIGAVCEELAGLSESYAGAKNAAFYGESKGGNQSVYIDYIEPGGVENMDWSDKEISAILREIRVGDEESLGKKIEEFMSCLKDSQMPVPQFKTILLELACELYKMTCSYQMEAAKIFGEDMDVYRVVSHFTTLEGIRQWLLESCLKIRKSISRERKNSAKILVDKAVAYLEEHYGDSSLSVEKICGSLNVSAAYFCTIFKKETGKTFLNYLTDVRMEKAVRLLEETEEKSYIISEMVGYAEPNYFSYVFKKKYGLAPSKYRKNRLEQKDG
jgi:two-component system response regulator YesN